MSGDALLRAETRLPGRRSLQGGRPLGALLALAGCLLAPPAFGEGPGDALDSASIVRRLDQQEAEIRRLRQRLEAVPDLRRLPPVVSIGAAIRPAVHQGSAEVIPPGPAVADDLPAGASFSAAANEALSGTPVAHGAQMAAGDGWQDLSEEKWTVKLAGHVQADYILWPHKDPAITSPLAKNYFEFRRLRLIADGTGYGVYDFRLQMTLEPETINETPNVTSPEVKDAYFSINEVPWLNRVRIGNFFVPFSLEQVTNDTNSVFLERSIPTQGVFAADREVGLAAYNHSADLNATWTCGIFLDNISDALKERIDNTQGTRVAGRLTWLPYYDEPSHGRYLVHTGLGVLYTHDHDDIARFRTRPQIHEGPRLIDSGPIPATDYTTGNVELATVMGSITVQSEMFLSSVNRNVGPAATISGAYIHVSYFLTGENRIYERFGQHGAQFARNVPYQNVFFVPGCFSLGAIELKGRWSNLNLSQLDAGQYNDFTFGFNWYWSDRVRAMVDWIHPITTAQTVFGATESDILGMRFDWNW